jgi:O-acetyl-ADP-ribose deacetylase (regulator of RNase III)
MSAKISLFKGDITSVKTDAIVNAANTGLMGGGGVDGAIHRAGGLTISNECAAIRRNQGGCNTGEAVITNAGNLPCKKVIHTVGPVYQNGKQHEADLLGACYTNSLRLAAENNLRTVAFPNISTGVYLYPKQQAADVAIASVEAFIDDNPNGVDEVIFVCYDEENFSIYQQLLRKA